MRRGCFSYVPTTRLFLILLVKERRNIDETGGHRIVILVVRLVVGVRCVQHVEHFAAGLDVDGCDVLCRALVTYVLVLRLVWGGDGPT